MGEGGRVKVDARPLNPIAAVNGSIALGLTSAAPWTCMKLHGKNARRRRHLTCTYIVTMKTETRGMQVTLALLVAVASLSAGVVVGGDVAAVRQPLGPPSDTTSPSIVDALELRFAAVAGDARALSSRGALAVARP